MDKKLKKEIAGGVVLAAVIIFGGLIWVNSQKKLATDNSCNEINKISQENPGNQSIQNLSIPGEWKHYKSDILGIEFYYPEKWGEPKTNPIKHITNLSHAVDGYTGNNIYNNNLAIIFSGENTPTIHIFNENFKAQNSPSYYTITGIAGNITDLKKAGNICDYKIDFSYGNGNLFKEVYSKCDAGIKEVLMQETEDFRNSSMADVGVLYSYDLSQLAFKKLQNGHFDNALIRYNAGRTWQIKESSLTNVGEFLSMVKINDNDYEQMKNDFAIFTGSVKSYQPVVFEKGVFQNIPGEDPNITTIRKYYFSIAHGKIEDAYSYYKGKNVSFDEFKGWYQNTYYANPTQFEKTGANQYKFFVDFQDNNQDPQRYRVTMEVSDDKIKPLSSEEIIGGKATFKNKSVFAVQRQGKNYVILSENNQERVIDQDDAPNEGNNFMGLSFFEPKFSPSGNYISYRIIGYEWCAIRIYDTRKNKMVLELLSGDPNGFTPNEEYFYACAINQFAGEQYGYVYKLPDFEVQYDLFDDNSNENYMRVECNYDNAEKVIRFTLSDYDTYQQNGQDDPGQKRVIEYSLVDKKAYLAQ